MKRLFLYIFVFGFLTIAASAESKNFIAGFEDIPLMNGFRQIENDNFSFGNEETRYIETQIVADNKKNFTEVKKFYTESLKQLGWRESANTTSGIRFYRENDVLEINLISKFPLKIRIILKNRV